jgi:glutaredoxin 3
MRTQVTIYTTVTCPYCHRAKSLLRARGIDFQEVDVTDDPVMRERLIQTTGRRTVPQIFIGDALIGGSDELHALDRAGELARRVFGPRAASPGAGAAGA